MVVVECFQFVDQCIGGIGIIVVQYVCVVGIEECVFDVGKVGVFVMFDYYYVVCVDYIQDRYVVDWVCWVGVCDWVDYVIGIDYQYYIGVGEFGIDVVYVGDQVVGYVGFGQQDIYVFGYVFGDGMDCEFYFDVVFD